MHFYWVWMDCSLLYVPQFFIKDFFFCCCCWLVIYFYQTFCCCCLVLSLLYFLSNIFSFLTGLSSLLGPLGFWHLALPVGVCSLECNNNNNSVSQLPAFQNSLCWQTFLVDDLEGTCNKMGDRQQIRGWPGQRGTKYAADRHIKLLLQLRREMTEIPHLIYDPDEVPISASDWSFSRVWGTAKGLSQLDSKAWDPSNEETLPIWRMEWGVSATRSQNHAKNETETST